MYDNNGFFNNKFTELKAQNSLNVLQKKKGINIEIGSNCFKLIFSSHLKKYNLYINPKFLDSITIRKKLVGILKEKLKLIYGEFFFSDNVIYSFKKNDGCSFKVQLNQQNYQVQIELISEVKSLLTKLIPFYKRFIYKLLSVNNLICINKNYFEKINIVSFKDLEIWTGFHPTINILNEKLFLNLCDITFIIRKQFAIDVLDNLKMIYKGEIYKSQVNEYFKNIPVVTVYNNYKIFIVQCVDFNKTPKNFFQMKDKNISFLQYFYDKYNYKIKNEEQPMLKCFDKKSKIQIYLVPEMCLMTRLTNQMKSDTSFLNKIELIKSVKKIEKREKYIDLIQTIMKSDESKEIIDDFGITIDQEAVTINEIKLNDVKLKNKDSIHIKCMNFDTLIQSSMYLSQFLKQWAIIYFNSFIEEKELFFQKLFCGFKEFQIKCNNPQIYEMNINNSYDSFLNSKISNDIKFIMIIIPGEKGKSILYNQSKIILNGIKAIPNQIILESTAKKACYQKTILNKIIIQINAKIGGLPWIVEDLPLNNKPTMIMSIFYQKDFISSVATYDLNFSQYFTNVRKIDNQIIGNIISSIFNDFMDKFVKKYKIECQRIIIFKDIVNLNDYEKIAEIEIKAIESIIKYEKSKSKISYILTNRKHNLNFIKKNEETNINIPSGTIINSPIIGDYFEFFLINQSTQDGISQATQYKILYDNNELNKNDLYNLIYKLCFLNYNYFGATRVPAPIYYSKKLADFVYENMRYNGIQYLPNKKMDGLFFI